MGHIAFYDVGKFVPDIYYNYFKPIKNMNMSDSGNVNDPELLYCV